MGTTTWLDGAFGVPEAVFGARARALGWAWLAAVTVGAVVVATAVRPTGMSPYLLDWVVVSALFSVPAVPLTSRVVRSVAPPDRPAWRLWLIGLFLLWAIGSGLIHVSRHPDTPVRHLGILAVVGVTAVLDTSCLLMMRRRSGRRSLAVDIVEVLVAATVVLGGAALVLGDAVVNSPAAWFTRPVLLSAAAVVIALAWAVVLYRRMPRGDRVLEGLGIAVGVAALADAAGQLAQGLSNFSLSPAPLLAVHALAMGLLVVLPLHASRLPSTGLERMPAVQQVRGSRALVAMTVASLPVLGLIAFLVRERTPWAGAALAAVLAVLVVLGAVRTLLVLDETKRLYAEVQAAAEERRRLLADVLGTVDDERRQVADQLHRQALASYSTFASFVSGTPAALDGAGRDASLRIRSELERNAEVLGELRSAVATGGTERAGGSTSHRIATVVRAHLVRLYGDTVPPHLEVDVAPGIVLDWTTGTLVLRFLQGACALAMAADARYLRVAVGAHASGVEVSVLDDGVALDADGPAGDPLADLRALVALAGGSLEAAHRPGRGTTVTARFGSLDSSSPRRRPVLFSVPTPG